MVAELTMVSRRFTDEADILKLEISNFLCHFKDSVIPALQVEEISLKKTIWWRWEPTLQKEVDVLEMALQISDILLLEDDLASIRKEDGERIVMRNA